MSNEIELSSVMTPVGLKPGTVVSLSDAMHIIDSTTMLITSSKFARGDVLNALEKTMGQSWTQIIPDDSLTVSKGTLSNEKSISKYVPYDIRRPELSYSHHSAVAYLERDKQVMWLQFAVENNLTRDELRAHISGRILNDGPMQLVLPPKSYTRDEVKSAFNRLLLHVDRNDETAELIDLCVRMLEAMK